MLLARPDEPPVLHYRQLAALRAATVPFFISLLDFWVEQRTWTPGSLASFRPTTPTVSFLASAALRLLAPTPAWVAPLLPTLFAPQLGAGAEPIIKAAHIAAMVACLFIASSSEKSAPTVSFQRRRGHRVPQGGRGHFIAEATSCAASPRLSVCSSAGPAVRSIDMHEPFNGQGARASRG